MGEVAEYIEQDDQVFVDPQPASRAAVDGAWGIDSLDGNEDGDFDYGYYADCLANEGDDFGMFPRGSLEKT